MYGTPGTAVAGVKVSTKQARPGFFTWQVSNMEREKGGEKISTPTVLNMLDINVHEVDGSRL
jgi:hypothetical protein